MDSGLENPPYANSDLIEQAIIPAVCFEQNPPTAGRSSGEIRAGHHSESSMSWAHSRDGHYGLRLKRFTSMAIAMAS
jgi:hypothetical protein